MQTIIKSSLLGSIPLIADKGNVQAVAVWVFTALVFIVGFRLAREVAAAVLMKLYELLIQKNAAGMAI